MSGLSSVYLCTLGGAVDIARQRATLTGHRHRVRMAFPRRGLPNLGQQHRALDFNYYRIQEA